jgi:hypothetical protein
MKLKEIVVMTAAGSLVAVVVVMMFMFILALLDPTVPDDAIFAIIGPAFQTIVGGFIGLITGINIKSNDGEGE